MAKYKSTHDPSKNGSRPLWAVFPLKSYKTLSKCLL